MKPEIYEKAGLVGKMPDLWKAIEERRGFWPTTVEIKDSMAVDIRSNKNFC